MKRPLGLLFLTFLRTASLCFQQRSRHTIVRGFLCWVSWLLRSRFLLSTRCARSISTSMPSSVLYTLYSCVVLYPLFLYMHCSSVPLYPLSLCFCAGIIPLSVRAYYLCELMVNYLGVRYIRDYPKLLLNCLLHFRLGDLPSFVGRFRDPDTLMLFLRLWLSRYSNFESCLRRSASWPPFVRDSLPVSACIRDLL